MNNQEQKPKPVLPAGRPKWLIPVVVVVGVVVIGLIVWGVYFLIKQGPPQLPAEGPFDEWRVCNDDSDCVETQRSCCDCNNGGEQTAINKQYLEKWESLIRNDCEDIVCISLFACKQGKPVCENNKCGFEVSATEGWRIYSNRIIGIEFKYPDDWPVLEKEDRGDERGTSFDLELPDLSHLDHTYLDYDNMSIDEQYEQIKCEDDYDYFNDECKERVESIGYDNLSPDEQVTCRHFYIECEERISENGARYVWKASWNFRAGTNYSALVPTGKYILIFAFQDKENYEKRADQYQKLLSTLKIPEDETANWEIYQNENYGFEVKYPGDLVIEEKANSISLWTEEEMQYLEGRPRLAIGMDNLNNKSFEEWIQNDLGLASFIDLRDGLSETGMKAEDIFIDNKKGLKIHEPGHAEGIFHHYISSGNVIIDIATYTERYLDDTFNQILSTFKFIESEDPCNIIDHCNTGSDCEYIWFTGGCYNVQYVEECKKKQAEEGLFTGEARPREGVTCSCENNKCITHN